MEKTLDRGLLIDLGNSTATVSDYVFGAALNPRSMDHQTFKDTMQASGRYSFVICASVVPSLNAWVSRVSDCVYFISEETLPTLRIALDKKGEVGSDRIVSALAAYAEYGGDLLVVDAGTAITFCYVSKEGVYEGGAIFPGMRIASMALNDYTEKIPKIFVSKQEHCLGKTTDQAVRIGLYYGYIHAINGLIHEYKEAYPSAKVIATGKGIECLVEKLNVDIVDQELILKGLVICADTLVYNSNNKAINT